MALQKALFAGDDSTPDAVKRRMMLADLLRRQGADVSKVDSPLEAIGSILQSGAAYLGERRAQEDQAAGLKTRAEGWQKLASSYMGGGAAGASGSMGGADLGGGMDLGGGAIAPSGATANLKPADREDYVMNYYIGKGLAPHQAAGFTGNLIQESSLNTGANNPGDGADGSDSIGIMQANGDRARNLRAFAKGTGRDIGDLDAQLDFTLHEMGIGNPEWRNLPGWGSEGPAGQALKSAQDVQSAAAAGISYERPAGWNRANPTAGHGWDNRFGHAQRLAGMNWSGQQVASASPAPATQQPVQVASLDPSAGMAQTTSAPPTARMIVEQAAARQQAGNPPEMGAQDVAAIQARPKDAQAVPYSGTGATIDPSQAAALAQGGTTPAAPALQASAPVGAPSAQNRQLGALLLAGAQPGPASGVSDAMIAELLGNAWTEDIGQMALQRKIQDNAANARLTQQFQLDQAKRADERQYDRAKTIDQRQYDQMTEAQKRAYEEQVRQQGYAREDSRNNYLDARQGNRDARSDLESDRNFDRAVRADQKPPTSVQEYEYARQNGFKGSFAEWETQNRRASATNINTANNSSKFMEKSDEAASKRLDEVIQGGGQAAQTLGDVQQLADLGRQIGTGKRAQIMMALGPYAEAFGLQIANLPEAQAYESIIARMAPQMRPAGSGASSDFDAKQFLLSLASIGNTPEGNQIITDTFAAVQQNKLQAAEIASLAYIPQDQGGITWMEAEKRIRSLPNPYERFKATRAVMEGRTNAPAPPSGGQLYDSGGVPLGGTNQPQPSATQRARNPVTGEILELRNGQWELVR